MRRDGAQSVGPVWLSAKYVRTVACCGSQPSASVRLVSFVNAGHTLGVPVFCKMQQTMHICARIMP